MRHLAPLLFSICACSGPGYWAAKIVERVIPAADLGAVRCTAQNGNIVVRAEDGLAAVRVHVQMKVRGRSQADADANLESMTLAQRVENGVLHLIGEHPAEKLRNSSPSYQFTVQVPRRFAVECLTDNGNIEVEGGDGPLALETANGSVKAKAAHESIKVKTLNGSIVAVAAAPGALDAVLTTLNGSIAITVDPGASATVDARTYNGTVTVPSTLVESSATRTRVTGRLGDGRGSLAATTHNGSIVIR